MRCTHDHAPSGMHILRKKTHFWKRKTPRARVRKEKKPDHDRDATVFGIVFAAQVDEIDGLVVHRHSGGLQVLRLFRIGAGYQHAPACESEREKVCV